MATPDSAESSPTVPVAPPDASTSLHLMFGGDAGPERRWSTVEAHTTPRGVTYLHAFNANGSRLTLSGSRAAVNRAVEDLVRALAALDAEGEGGAP